MITAASPVVAAASAQTIRPPVAPKAHPLREEPSFELPAGYGHTTIVALVRDPWWIFSYWEVTPETEQAVRGRIPPSEREGIVSILRVHDVTDGEADAPRFDIALRDVARNWYIHVGKPDRVWIVEIGLRTPRGGFYRLARSNRVRTPRHGPSDVIDEEWMSIEEEYWKLFGVAGGFGIGQSSMDIRRRFRQQRWPGSFSSFGVSPAAATPPDATPVHY